MSHFTLDLRPGVVLVNSNTGKRVRIAEVRGESFIVNWGQSADDPRSTVPLFHTAMSADLGWSVVAPYVCGSCGLEFYEETPAGRCPNEYEHEPLWNVYALIDGEIDGEDSCNDMAEAAIKFAQAVQDYNDLADRGELTADVTVHLYHPDTGNIMAERHVSAYRA